ncbi:MAG: hypothetical protein ACI4PU_00175, partial [Intestinibacter sp.]
IKSKTEILSKQICELEKKCEASKQILRMRKENEAKKDLVDSLFFDVVSIMHPDIYNLKSDILWEKAKKAYLNYDDSTLALLKNLKVKTVKNYDISDLKNNIFLLENEIICMKKRYPYDLERNLSSDEWIDSYDKEITDRIKKLEFEEKKIFEKLV